MTLEAQKPYNYLTGTEVHQSPGLGETGRSFESSPKGYSTQELLGYLASYYSDKILDPDQYDYTLNAPNYPITEDSSLEQPASELDVITHMHEQGGSEPAIALLEHRIGMLATSDGIETDRARQLALADSFATLTRFEHLENRFSGDTVKAAQIRGLADKALKFYIESGIDDDDPRITQLKRLQGTHISDERYKKWPTTQDPGLTPSVQRNPTTGRKYSPLKEHTASQSPESVDFDRHQAA